MEKVNNYFSELEKVAEGTSSMTSQLEAFCESLAANKLPRLMADIWDYTEYPDEWIRIIGRKTGLLKNWALALSNKSLYDGRLPLGVFLQPEILLNTLRQKTCRHLKKPLDELEMQVTFGDSHNLSPFCLTVGDMMIEGGRINRGAVETSVNVAERETVESVSIGFVDKDTTGSQTEVIEVPVYLTTDKESMLMRVRVPFSGERNEIVLSGCCLYL